MEKLAITSTCAATPPKNIRYELYHSAGDFLWVALKYGRSVAADEIKEGFRIGNYHHVKDFRLPPTDVEQQLEQIFFLSNHWKGLNRRHRSTSVGDLIKVGNEYWVVAPVGFDKLWED